MASLLNSRGVINVASLFKLLMVGAMLSAFMPSLLRLGDSRLSLSYLYIIVCFGVLGIVVLRDGRLASFYLQLARHNKLLFGSLLAIAALHVIRYAISPADGPMSRTLMALMVFVTVYFYFSFLFYRDANNLYFFYRVITIGLLLNLFAIMLYANGIYIMPNYYAGFDRYTGLFSHPNQLAIFVSTIFIFYVASYFSAARLGHRFVWLSMLFTALVVSVLAGSKTNILVSGVILIAYLLWSVSRKNALIVLLSIVLLGLLFSVAGASDFLVSLNPRLFGVFADLSPDNVGQYRTILSRTEIWVYSWEVGTAYPFLGEGWAEMLPGDLPHSHNIFMDYLRLFGPLGLLAITLFLLAVVMLFARVPHSAHNPHVLKACKLSILAYLLANMLSDSMGPQTIFFLAFFVAYLSVIPGKIYTFNPQGATFASRSVAAVSTGQPP